MITLINIIFPLRSDRELCALLGKRGQAPVSVEQGITLSQQIGCVMYVETTSRFNRQSVLSAFEIAALAALGQITPKVGYLLKCMYIKNVSTNYLTI